MTRTIRLGGRIVILLAILAIGCGSQDSTGLPPGVTAVAGNDTLYEVDLEELLAQSPDVPDLDDARSLVSTWINLALFKSAYDRDPTLASFRERSLETIIQDLAVLSYAEQIGENARAPSEAEIDSVIRSNAVRTFDAYLIPIAGRSDTAAMRFAAVVLEQFRAEALQLGSPIQAYDRLPAEVSRRFDLVRLGAVGRNDIPAELGDELWKLGQGELSPVIGGPAGFQVFVRRSSQDFRPLVADWLKPQIRARSDAAFVDSLAAARGITLAGDAIDRLREAMHEPAVVRGETPLASWEGGDLSPASATRRIGGLPPNDRAALADGSDTMIVGLIDRFSRAELLAGIATEQLTSAQREQHLAAAMERWQSSIDSLQSTLARPGVGNVPGEWLRSIVNGRMPARTLPGGLAGVLRAESAVVVDRESARRATAAALRRWGTSTAT